MRGLLALLLVGSVNAMACPNIAGSYTCSYPDGTSETITVSQEDQNGVTFYDFGDGAAPADNVVYALDDNDTLKNTTFRSWCDGDNMLIGQLIGKYFRDGQYYGDLSLDLTYSLVDGNLKDTSSGTLTNAEGVQPFQSENVCIRN